VSRDVRTRHRIATSSLSLHSIGREAAFSVFFYSKFASYLPGATQRIQLDPNIGRWETVVLLSLLFSSPNGRSRHFLSGRLQRMYKDKRDKRHTLGSQPAKRKHMATSSRSLYLNLVIFDLP
jgi:hypothetical protein